MPIFLKMGLTMLGILQSTKCVRESYCLEELPNELETDRGESFRCCSNLCRPCTGHEHTHWVLLWTDSCYFFDSRGGYRNRISGSLDTN
jgi:hypothetical protein